MRASILVFRTLIGSLSCARWNGICSDRLEWFRVDFASGKREP
jgi:hypothetical protein